MVVGRIHITVICVGELFSSGKNYSLEACSDVSPDKTKMSLLHFGSGRQAGSQKLHNPAPLVFKHWPTELGQNYWK